MKTKLKLFVKPAPGLRVWNPERKRALREEGELVTPSPYWLRRLQDSDATEQPAPVMTDASRDAQATEAPPLGDITQAEDTPGEDEAGTRKSKRKVKE